VLSGELSNGITESSQRILLGYALDYNTVQRGLTGRRDALERPLTTEDRTARLTILIDPRKKAVFERLCADEDATPSQVVRRLIRRYILERTGKPWAPPTVAPKLPARSSARRPGVKRSRRESAQDG
jgi:hypothetical protein